MFNWFKPKPPKVWHYVGTCTFTTDIQDKGKTIKTLVHKAVMHMTDQNDRRVAYSSNDSSDYYLKQHRYYPVIQAWKNGGKFPEAGMDVEDSLGEMLNRMLDAKITGKTMK